MGVAEGSGDVRFGELVPVVELETRIAAPVGRCFDLARSVDAHLLSADQTGERAIAGVTSGLMGEGDWVTWQARHLGVRQTLTVRITAFDAPHHFRDSMVRGAFARFDHDHWFDDEGGGTTRMRDRFAFEAPLGVLGRIANALFLTSYMRRFLCERNAFLKRVAESEDWRRLLGR